MNHPDAVIKLNDARLQNMSLEGCNLRGSDLSSADLRGTILDGAILDGATLRAASLQNSSMRGVSAARATFNRADLRGASLEGANLAHAKFGHCIFWQANLNGISAEAGHFRDADLASAKLRGANLNGARLVGASLNRADLSGATLVDADLQNANLNRAILENADLTRCALQRASLVETRIEGAILTGSKVFGVSAWAVEGKAADEQSLICTPHGDSPITVDRLDLAQFIYLLLYSEGLRNFIDTIATKLVLILGRFTPARKAVLDRLRDELRRRDMVPVVFDFSKPSSRDLSETVSALAHLAQFVLVDLTDATSVPHELESTVPHLPSVTFVPLIEDGQNIYAMFEHIERYPWVMQPITYAPATLAADLVSEIMGVVETARH